MISILFIITKLDILMMKYISADDTKIIIDDKGRHYAVRLVQNVLILDTIKEIEGIYVSYYHRSSK